MSHRVTILSTLLLAGCASRGYVTEEVSGSQGIMRGEIQDMRRQLSSRLDELQREVDANKQASATAEDLAKVKRTADQGVASADQTAKTLAALGREVESMRQIVDLRKDLQAKLENAVQTLTDAKLEFQKHRTEVDHRLSNMDVKVDDVGQSITTLEKRLSDFFYLQQKNLRREKDSLIAEVELIDKLMAIIAGVETLPIPPEGNNANGNQEPPPQAQNGGREDGH